MVRSRPSHPRFKSKQAAVFRKEVLTHTNLPIKRQADNVSDEMVNLVERLAAKELDVFLGRGQKTAKRRVIIRNTFTRRAQQEPKLKLLLLCVCRMCK